MSGRFRLDPRDRREPPPPPEPLAPAAPAAPPAAPKPLAPEPPAAAPPRRGRRRAIVLLIVLVLVVGAAAAAAYLAFGQDSYPERYVLASKEYPAGMRLAPLNADERDRLGIESNPGEVDPQHVKDEYGGTNGGDPDRGYAQALTVDGGRVVILALQYPEENDARDAARDLRAVCTFANGAVMREGRVLVVVVPEGGASRAAVRDVVGALREKTSALVPVCGAGS